MYYTLLPKTYCDVQKAIFYKNKLCNVLKAILMVIKCWLVSRRAKSKQNLSGVHALQCTLVSVNYCFSYKFSIS